MFDFAVKPNHLIAETFEKHLLPLPPLKNISPWGSNYWPIPLLPPDLGYFMLHGVKSWKDLRWLGWGEL